MDKKRILIVEDEQDMMEMLGVRLRASGFDIVSAVDGEDALEKAGKEDIDLILLDIMLPKVDGYEVCRILRRKEYYKNIPILMLTAKAHEKEERQGYECGANAYFSKPFEPEALMNKINELLK